MRSPDTTDVLLRFWGKANVCAVGLILAVLLCAACVVNHPANRVAHVVLEPLLPDDQCDRIVEAAERAALVRGGWMSHRHKSYPTTDLSAFDIPMLEQFWNSSLSATIFKRMHDIFELGPYVSKQQTEDILYLRDLFVVKYTSDGQRSLSLHMDGSHLSFNVALRTAGEDYTGGGTFIKAMDRTIVAKKGQVLFHPSCIYHQGVEITEGTRYILVGFVKVKNFPSWRLWGNLATEFVLREPDNQDQHIRVSFVRSFVFLLYRAFYEMSETAPWVLYLLGGCILLIIVLSVSIAHDHYQISKIQQRTQNMKKRG